MRNVFSITLTLFVLVIIGGCSSTTDSTVTSVKSDDFKGEWTVLYKGLVEEVEVDVLTEQYTGTRIILSSLGDVDNLYFLTAKTEGSTLSGISVGSLGYKPYSQTITYPADSIWNSTPNPDFVFASADYYYHDIRGKLELTMSKDGKSFTGIYREAVEGVVPPSQTERKWVLRSKTEFTGTRQ
ncbi:MAG: hypothetical protein HYZ54_03425 [Ignavibacteriae bacterium]|nr:hypothetical protein [Ignavibacteriota bacterium]